MNLKKSIFSYIILAAFACCCGAEIIFALESSEIVGMLNWSYPYIGGAVCGYLLLTAVVFFALRTLCTEIKEHISDRERFEKILSVVFPVVVLIGTVVYLVLYVLYHTPLTFDDYSFYRQALVSAGQSVPFAVHGASWIYLCLLHVMLLIFGNTPFAGVVLQIILFFIALLLLYIGMQSFAGVLPAAVSMAALGFLPVSLQFVFSLTPEFFCLTLYLLGFCLTGTFFRKFKEQRDISSAQFLSVFLLGVYIGVLAGLDLYGISLYFFFTLLFSVEKERIKQAVSVNLTALLGGVAGFGVFAAAASWMGRMSLSAYLEKLFLLYEPADFQREIVRGLLPLPDVTLVGALLLISFAFFAVPAFFMWKRDQNSAFILNLFLVYGMALFSVFYLNAQIVATLSWSILAGFGFCGVIRQTEVKAGEDESGKMFEIPEEEKKSEIKVHSKSVKDMDTESETTEKKEQIKPAPGKPLPNPLPVPKKKIRPQADFGHQVNEADMMFDTEVADDDDFDV